MINHIIVIMDYNVIITAFRGELYNLLRVIRGWGVFHRTPFRDVLVGVVNDLNGFFEFLAEEAPLSLGRVIPVDVVIPLSNPDSLLNDLRSVVKDLVINGSFRVTVERRGWKGVINSFELAKSLGSFINESLGLSVDLVNPDSEVVISILNDSCGVSVISKELRSKYLFIRAKR